MTLRERQSLFVKNIGKLIEYAYAQGYELTFGDAYRDPQQAIVMAATGKGIKNSLHIDRLAIDFNLFQAGTFMKDTMDFERLGAYWKSLHPDNRWGGDFITRKDGNHFSMTDGSSNRA